MVQVIKTGPSGRQLMQEMIGQTLSSGLANFTGNYFANKSLDNILNSEEFKKGSESERSDKLVRALQPYGEIGHGILQQRLGIEQKRAQEASKKSLGKVFGKLQRGETIEPEDFQKLDEASQKQVLQGMQQQILQKQKTGEKQSLLNQKENMLSNVFSPGGMSQPVPQQQNDQPITNPSMSQQSPQPSIQQAYQTSAQQPAFNPLNVSDEQIARVTAIDPNIGRSLQHAKDVALREARETESLKNKNFQSDRAYHSKTSDPIVDEANKVLKAAPIKKGLINQHRRDIASGNVTGFGPFLADKTGWEIFRNPEAARARSAAKQYFIQSLNSLANGARPNIFLEQQLSAGQTQIGREEEANQTVLDLMEFADDLETQRAQFISELAKEDEDRLGYVKKDIESRANKLMIPFAEQREDEMAYTIRKRHEDEIDDAKLTQEIFSGQIPPDTPLTLRAARILMIKNNDNEAKAQAEAKRLGFKIPTEQTFRKGR